VVQPFGTTVAGRIGGTSQSTFDQIATEFYRLLSEAYGDADKLLSTTNLISTYLNTVNCSAAPNCDSQNRESCLVKDHTCGECKTGYGGVDGIGNTQCLNLTVLQARRKVGESCSVNIECALSSCIGGFCSEPLKTCIDDCSGFGTCMTEDLLGVLSLTDCAVTDLTCNKKCYCNAGYFGLYCQFDSAYYYARANLRTATVHALMNVTLLAETTADAVVSWIDAMTAISTIPDEVMPGVKQVSALVDDLGTYCYQTACAYTRAMQLLTAISNSIYSLTQVAAPSTASLAPPTLATDDISKGRRLTASSELVAAVNVFKSITTAMSQDMFDGQIPPEFSSMASQAIVLVNSFANIQGSYVVIPSFSTDILAETTQSAKAALLALNVSGSTSPSMMMSGVAFVENPYGSESIPYNASSRVHRIMVGPSDGTTTSGVSAMTLRVVLKHVLLDDYVDYYEVVSNQSVGCQPGFFAERSANFSCPWGNYTIQCDGTGLEYWAACIQEGVRRRSCGVFDGTKFGVDSTCTIEKYTPHNTTCICQLRNATNVYGNVSAHIAKDFGSFDVVALSQFEVIKSGVSRYVHPIEGPFEKQYIKHSYLFTIGFVTVWVFFFTALILYIRYMIKQDPKGGKIAVDDTTIERKDPVQIASDLNYYISNLFPMIFTSTLTTLTRIGYELSEHHLWFRIFLSRDKCREHRYFSGLHLLTSVSGTLFVVAFLMIFQVPEDIDCGLHLSKKKCEEEKTILDSTLSKCGWVANPEKADELNYLPHCQWQEPVLTAQVFIAITLIVLICTAFLDALTQYLVNEILIDPPRKRTSDPKEIKYDDPLSATIPTKKVRSYASRHLTDLVVQSQSTAIQAIAARTMDASVLGISSEETAEAEEMRLRRLREALSVNESNETNPEGELGKLVGDIRKHRSTIENPEDVQIFDAYWGLLQVDGVKSNKTMSQMITEELTSVNELTAQYVRLISNPNMTVESKGVEILILFVLDILGRTSVEARALLSHTESDMRPVTLYSFPVRVCTFNFLILLNCLFVVLSCLLGTTKGASFQLYWMGISLAQLFIAMVLSEVWSVWSVYYWFPRALLRSYMYVIDTMHATVYDFCAPLHSVNPDHMNAAEYMFVSNKVAKRFPDIAESKLVLAYHNSVPGMAGRRWNKRSLKALRQQPFGPGYSIIQKAFLYFMTLNLTIQKLSVKGMEVLLILFLFTLAQYDWGQALMILFLLLIILWMIVIYIRHLIHHHKKEEPTGKFTKESMYKAVRASLFNMEFRRDFRDRATHDMPHAIPEGSKDQERKATNAVGKAAPMEDSQAQNNVRNQLPFEPAIAGSADPSSSLPVSHMNATDMAASSEGIVRNSSFKSNISSIKDGDSMMDDQSSSMMPSQQLDRDRLEDDDESASLQRQGPDLDTTKDRTTLMNVSAAYSSNDVNATAAFSQRPVSYSDEASEDNVKKQIDAFDSTDRQQSPAILSSKDDDIDDASIMNNPTLHSPNDADDMDVSSVMAFDNMDDNSVIPSVFDSGKVDVRHTVIHENEHDDVSSESSRDGAGVMPLSDEIDGRDRRDDLSVAEVNNFDDTSVTSEKDDMDRNK